MTAVANDMWDIVIVGTGPAGSTAAIAAARAWPGARILILETESFPRDKPCGDGVAMQALESLDDLGVDSAALVAGYAPPIRLRLISPSGLEVATDFASPPACIVPRSVFDHRLLTHATAAGAAALDPDPSTAYQHALHDRLGNHLRRADMLVSMCTPTFVDVAVSAVQETPDLLDTVVEIGLREDDATDAELMADFGPQLMSSPAFIGAVTSAVQDNRELLDAPTRMVAATEPEPKPNSWPVSTPALRQ